METRQLEYFVAVAEELSFTRAAQRLYAVQSTVSATIRSLETDLHTKLFERSTRRVELTAAGSAFLPEAKAALEAVDRARAVVEEASAGLRGGIRIGTLTSVDVLDLPSLLGAFHRRYPLVDIHVTVSATGSAGLAEDVRQGRLDAAQLGLAAPDLHGLDARHLGTRPYIAVLPRDHPLADAAEVRLEDLADELFVDSPSGFGNRLAVDRAYTALGLHRRVSIEVSDLRTAPDYVAAGLGVAIIPVIGPEPRPDTVGLPLIDSGLTWPFTMVTRAGVRPSRALSTLLDLIKPL